MILNHAIDQLSADNNAEALHLFDQAISENPSMPAIAYGKAIALARLGRTEDALKTLDRLLTVMPEHEKARQLSAPLTVQEHKPFLPVKNLIKP